MQNTVLDFIRNYLNDKNVNAFELLDVMFYYAPTLKKEHLEMDLNELLRKKKLEEISIWGYAGCINTTTFLFSSKGISIKPLKMTKVLDVRDKLIVNGWEKYTPAFNSIAVDEDF